MFVLINWCSLVNVKNFSDFMSESNYFMSSLPLNTFIFSSLMLLVLDAASYPYICHAMQNEACWCLIQAKF